MVTMSMEGASSARFARSAAGATVAQPPPGRKQGGGLGFGLHPEIELS